MTSKKMLHDLMMALEIEKFQDRNIKNAGRYWYYIVHTSFSFKTMFLPFHGE